MFKMIALVSAGLVGLGGAGYGLNRYLSDDHCGGTCPLSGQRTSCCPASESACGGEAMAPCATPCEKCAAGCDSCPLCQSDDCTACCGTTPVAKAKAKSSCCEAPSKAAVAAKATCCATPCPECAKGCDACCKADCVTCCGATVNAAAAGPAGMLVK